MQYLGGKVKLAKHILPIILQGRGENQTYVEPFMGGANVLDKVTGDRIGADSNKYLVQLLKDAQNKREFPRQIDIAEYKRVKQSMDEDEGLTAFVGFGCSFGGKWFGGFAKNKRGDNFANACANAMVKQGELLKDVELIHSNYEELELPPKSLIYCDPPYAGTTKYKDDFDHDKFWQWVREKGKEGHRVFVSEYSAPKDFECIWEKEVKTNLNQNKQESNTRIDRLFIQTI